jgi:hypothetical protein
MEIDSNKNVTVMKPKKPRKRRRPMAGNWGWGNVV